MVKVLINLGLSLFFISIAYSLFYFKVVPRLINHYRRFTQRRRQYDQEIKEIQDEDQ